MWNWLIGDWSHLIISQQTMKRPKFLFSSITKLHGDSSLSLVIYFAFSVCLILYVCLHKPLHAFVSCQSTGAIAVWFVHSVSSQLCFTFLNKCLLYNQFIHKNGNEFYSAFVFWFLHGGFHFHMRILISGTFSFHGFVFCLKSGLAFYDKYTLWCNHSRFINHIEEKSQAVADFMIVVKYDVHVHLNQPYWCEISLVFFDINLHYLNRYIDGAL